MATGGKKNAPSVAELFAQNMAQQAPPPSGSLLGTVSKNQAVPRGATIRLLSRDALVDSMAEHRIYDVDNLEALALDISVRGIQEPLQVIPIDGGDKYEIVSGHRRRAANDIAVEKHAYAAGSTLPCVVVERPIAGREFEVVENLILDNLQRDKSDHERMMEIIELYRCTEMRRERGENIPNIRERVKERLGVSDTEITRFRKIYSSLADVFRDDFRSGRIASTVAYDIAQMDPECQQYVSECWNRAKDPALTTTLLKDYAAKYIGNASAAYEDASEDSVSKYSPPIPQSIDEGVNMLSEAMAGITRALRAPVKMDKRTQKKLFKRIAKQMAQLNALQNELAAYGLSVDDEV